MEKLPLRLAAATLIFALVGCSTIYGGKQLTRPTKKLSVELFAARGFLNGSDYEQYRLVDGVLWRECGSLNAKVAKKGSSSNEGDTLLQNDPSLSPTMRRVEQVSNAELQALTDRAETVFGAVAESAASGLPAPGAPKGLTEPGVFELTIALDGDQRNIITSVDAIADGTGAKNDTIKKFFAKLRAVGPVICNARTFFGIQRDS